MRVLYKPLTRAKYVLLTLLIAFSQTALAVGPYIELQKAEAAPICAVDTAGANDEPGQKDLTKLCVDYAGVPTTVSTTWNWDELGTNGANTMDACNLFDTDNDGNINYAVCVTTEDTPAELQTLTTYSCGDDKIDRCTSPATPISSGTTSCTVSQQNTDPFAAGANAPKDTQGACTIQLSTVGGASAKLVDVCSYPSSQPNSDPSDCVIARNDFGKVELIKDLNPSTDTGLFNLTINGPDANDTTTVNNAGDGGTTGEVVVKKGVVVVSETAGTNTSLGGYNTTIICRDLNGTGAIVGQGTPTDATNRQLSFTLVEDTDVVCTITNTRQQATLILQKTVVNDDGGTLTQTDFPVAINGNAANWGSNSVTPGQYSVSETQQPGYAATVWGGDCDAQGNVTLANDQTKTCTITNNDIAPELNVTKRVINDDGGETMSTDFNLYVNDVLLDDARKGGGDVEDNSVTYLHGGTEANVNYTITEDNEDGYTLVGIVCTDDDTQQELALPLNLELGQKVSCTVTNTDDAPQLTIVKNVITDNGGTATANDFVLHLSGGAYAGTEHLSSGDTPDVSANTSYTLSEDAKFGYQQTNIGCTDDDTMQAVAHPVSLNPGQAVTCTVTNDDIAPKLTVVKVVDNQEYNGQLNADDFPLYVDDFGVESGVQNEFDAGDYTVTETQQDGYEFVDYSGDCLSDGSITMQVGGVYTCTLTNKALPVKVTVTKQVVNDDGGTASVSDFDLYVNNTQVNSGVENYFPANVEYTVSEQATVDGYEQTSLTCTNQDDETLGANFTPANGDEIDCVIVNDDNAPSLTLIKNVVNDYGQAADANEWTLTAAPQINQVGATTVSGDGDPFDGGGVNNAAVYANVTYDLSEADGPSGYTASNWVCDGGDQEGNDLTLSLGDDVTCTITNTANAPKLIVVKQVINDNGGGKNASDFTMNVLGNDVSDESFPGAELPGTTVTLDSGNYSVTETDPGIGYTVSYSPDCSGSIAIDETKTCVVTNDDNPGTITIIKDAQPDSDQPFTFTGNLTGENGPNFDLVDDGDNDGSEQRVFANMDEGTYTVTEPTVKGWTLEEINCEGGSDVNVNNLNAVIKLKGGENVTCTFVNTRDKGEISVTKILNPSDDDGRFDLLIDGTVYAEEVGHLGSTDSVEMVTGTYDISETAGNETTDLANYETVHVCVNKFFQIIAFGEGAVVEDIELAKDQKINCVFYNERHAEIVVTKFNDLDRDGEHDENEPTLPGWEMNLSTEAECISDLAIAYDNGCDDETYQASQLTGQNGSTTFTQLPAYDVYTLSETEQAGWHWSNTYCEYEENEGEGRPSDDNQYRIYPTAGETVECYVGNYQDPVLNLAKTNNKPIADNGDTVTYTLNVSVPEASGALFDVCVTDLLPEGFAYNGNWTADSTVADHDVASDVENAAENCGTAGGPSYASPGQWYIGTLLPGEVVTLTYEAVIGDSVFPGTYPDIAFAEGDACGPVAINCAEGGEVVYSNLSVADEPFVGTEVTLEGEVLAATTIRETRLVNTGDAYTQLYLTLAGLLLLSGVIVAKVQMTKKGGAR